MDIELVRACFLGTDLGLPHAGIVVRVLGRDRLRLPRVKIGA